MIETKSQDPSSGVAAPARRCEAEASGLSVVIHRTRHEMAGLEQAWRRLETTARVPCFFSSFDWCRHLVETFADNPGDAILPAIVTVHRGNRLVALWPLARTTRGGLTVLSSLGAPFDQYAEILVDRDEDRRTVLEQLVAVVRRAKLADGLVLRKVRAAGDARELEALGATLRDEQQRSPFIAIDPSANFAEVAGVASAKTRKNLRNYTNRLKRLGDLQHDVYVGQEISSELAASFEGRRRWLEENGLSSTAFRDARFSELVASLAGAPARPLGLIAFVLRLDGETIALQWGFVYQNRYIAFMAARDPEYDAYSVGRIHLLNVLEACHARGIGEVDLLVPDAPYKMTWATEARPVYDVVWPWTVRGTFALKLIEQHLRPQARRLISALPLRHRQRLMRLLNHTADTPAITTSQPS